MKTIKFSHNYVKTAYPLFTTLRRVPYWAPGEVVKAKAPSSEYSCLILSCETKRLEDFPPELLCYDTWRNGERKPDFDGAIHVLMELAKVKSPAGILHSPYTLYYLLKV